MPHFMFSAPGRPCEVEDPLFSLVIPTRDRPQYLRLALEFLQFADLESVEITVVDNPSHDHLGVREIVSGFAGLPVMYRRAPRELSMVDNWNFGYSCSRGEYVGFLTDKMLLLPGTLEQASSVVAAGAPDIISWIDSRWYPADLGEIGGTGLYVRRTVEERGSGGSCDFEPQEALKQKLSGHPPRNSMTPAQYALGKICFGAYRRSLCNSIVAQLGRLFLPLTPDYTSMTAALRMASTGSLLVEPGMVHLDSIVGNGVRGALDDRNALAFLDSVSDFSQDELLIPGLYSSVSNLVASDYARILRMLSSDLQPDISQWLPQFRRDLSQREGSWSTSEVRNRQWQLLEGFEQSWTTGQGNTKPDQPHGGPLRQNRILATAKTLLWKEVSKNRSMMLAAIAWRNRLRNSTEAYRLRSVRDIERVELKKLKKSKRD